MTKCRCDEFGDNGKCFEHGEKSGYGERLPRGPAPEPISLKYAMRPEAYREILNGIASSGWAAVAVELLQAEVMRLRELARAYSSRGRTAKTLSRTPRRTFR